jgi:hypothetical protein
MARIAGAACASGKPIRLRLRTRSCPWCHAPTAIAETPPQGERLIQLATRRTRTPPRSDVSMVSRVDQPVLRG